MKKALVLFSVLLSLHSLLAQHTDERGTYFAKKAYDGKDLPVFAPSKEMLPTPILEDNQEWVEMYWACWEMAFDHFKKPPQGSPFVSNILDEAFNESIFQWDMIFMAMFARYGNHIFPAIESLDNFYCRQHPSGYICRELSEKDGSDVVFKGRKHTINPPLFSWAEVESFNNTGDASRFEKVLPVLEKYVEWLNTDGDPNHANDAQNWYLYGRKDAKSVHHLYWNTDFGSGMDNTPRGGNGWVDMSCQMVIQYNNLAEMSQEIGLPQKAKHFKQEAQKIANRINTFCWSEEDGLYYDVDSAGNPVKWKTSGCFWPLLAGIASKKQSERLVENLMDTASFWRNNVFPTLAADQEGYDPSGGYWLGSVWAPTNYMIIKGLEQYGYEELAARATAKYLDAMYCVFDSTHTVWENYSPEYCSPGNLAKPDFVGWTGIGPIALLIENILGFRVHASDHSLTWNIHRTDEHGIKNLRIGHTTASLRCQRRKNVRAPLQLTVTTNDVLNLTIVHNHKKEKFKLDAGEHVLHIEP